MSKSKSCPYCEGEAIPVKYYDSWLKGWAPVQPAVYACGNGHVFTDVNRVRRMMKAME